MYEKELNELSEYRNFLDSYQTCYIVYKNNRRVYSNYFVCYGKLKNVFEVNTHIALGLQRTGWAGTYQNWEDWVRMVLTKTHFRDILLTTDVEQVIRDRALVVKTNIPSCELLYNLILLRAYIERPNSCQVILDLIEHGVEPMVAIACGSFYRYIDGNLCLDKMFHDQQIVHSDVTVGWVRNLLSNEHGECTNYSDTGCYSVVMGYWNYHGSGAVLNTTLRTVLQSAEVHMENGWYESPFPAIRDVVPVLYDFNTVLAKVREIENVCYSAQCYG